MVKNREGESAPPSPEDSDSEATSSSSEDEGSPSDPSAPTADKKFAAKKKALDPAADKTRDSGSGSDDPDSDSPVKPIASKPMDDGSKLKKPRSKPNSKSFLAASPTKTPTKRTSAAEGEKDTKKTKTEMEGGGGGEEEGKKTVLFQRLWSDDDEIAILKGMLDYKEEKGSDPMADANDFHDFIKKSLHVDVDRRQLVDKVRRLRKRYENSVGKRKSFNPHEKIVLEFSMKIWGNYKEGADLDQQSKSNMKTRTISKAATTTKSGGSAGMTSPTTYDSVVTYDGKKEAGNSGEVDKLENSRQFIGKASVSMGLDENIVKVGLELCKENRKAEIEEKWRKLHFEESDLFLRKLDLAREESEMIIAALKSDL